MTNTDEAEESAGHDPEFLRSMARQGVDQLVVNLNDLGSQMMSTSKWLSAALLTLNGGGMLATVGAIERLDDPLYATVFFCLGILLVMLNGVAIQHFAATGIPHVRELTNYWRVISHTGIRDEAVEQALIDSIGRANRWNWIAPLCGWISAGFFLAGVWALATGIEDSDADNGRRCVAIQRDMLSARPLRADDAVIFTALGCKPHGAGSVYAPLRRVSYRLEKRLSVE